MKASEIYAGRVYALGQRNSRGRLKSYTLRKATVVAVRPAPGDRFARRKAFAVVTEEFGARGFVPRGGGSFVVVTEGPNRTVVSAKDVLGDWNVIQAEIERDKAVAVKSSERLAAERAERSQAAEALRNVAALVGCGDPNRLIGTTGAPALLAFVRALAESEAPWRIALCTPGQAKAWVVCNAGGDAISRPLGRVQAEHMLAEINASVRRQHGRESQCFIAKSPLLKEVTASA